MMKKMVIWVIAMVSGLLLLTGTASAVSFLQDEAGISASIKLASANLTLAKNAFKAIERQTAGYIIGSVALAGYEESYDVHVYVDTSGHMVAYYLKSEPASKIIDWRGYISGPMTLAGSNLEDALLKVCNALSISLPAVTYYDFRYPDSQTIKIVTDEALVAGTDTFKILIPSGHMVYSATWSHGTYRPSGSSTYDSDFMLNGTTLNHFSSIPTGWQLKEGVIAPASLLLDTQHEFSIQSDHGDNDAYAAIVLIYQEIQ